MGLIKITHYNVICDRCGKAGRRFDDTREEAIQRAEQEGWDLKTERILCPVCRVKAKH